MKSTGFAKRPEECCPRLHAASLYLAKPADPCARGVVRILPPSRLFPLIGCILLLGGCTSPRNRAPDGVRYLHDALFRRAELEASLVNRENGYGRLRLAHYATGEAHDWERLPEWNPPVETIATSELDAEGGASATSLSADAVALSWPGTVTSEDDPALVELGEIAFNRYPVQLARYMSVALKSRAAAARYGLWVDENRGVGGLVRARMADGSGNLAMTCATCHSAPRRGQIISGLPNAQLDIGAAMLDSPGSHADPVVATAIARWGAGRLDVTTTQGTEPMRIPDLRPVRWLTHLHQDATLLARDRSTLAIRIETLIITACGQAQRPPRIVALAMAAYVESLANALPPVEAAREASPRGAEVFATHCAHCHVPPAFTGPPVRLAVVGTDPTIGLSAERGTGMYRVPSLHGVGTRGPLLHDGTVPNLEAMFDPARPTSAFTQNLHGDGPVVGHSLGLDLPSNDRRELVKYLEAL
jgi:mono/diheme cytochrome c family protein